jgi:DNA-binding protein YbaB
MISKLKQYNDLRKQASTIKNVMAEESIEVENKAIKIVMDGNQAIKSLSLKDEYLSPNKKKDLEKYIQEAIADAIKKVQRKMAMKMQKMGGLDSLMK